MTDHGERREFQRLRLPHPLAARFGAREARLLEIGIPGAKIEHEGPIKANTSGELVFRWGSDAIRLEAEVIRSVISSSSPSLTASPEDPAAGAHATYHSGLQFLRAIGESGPVLRRMLTESVRQLLEQHRVAMQEQPQEPTASGEEDTIRARNFGFICYTLDEGVWKKRRMFLPEQPAVGFTVSAAERKEEVQRICRAYEQADEEGRRLIRLFAELSVSEALNLPHS